MTLSCQIRRRWHGSTVFAPQVVWNIGRGKVFYFRPGHETYPVFKQPEVFQVIETPADGWVPITELNCQHFKKREMGASR